MATFNHPAFLVLAICLIPGFLLISALVRRLQNTAIGRFGQRETLSRFSRFSPKTTNTLLLSLSLASMAIAAAGPSLSRGENGSARTLNAIIVLDVSRSMLAEDGPGSKSRLVAGIESVEKLFETYPDGRFGLVLFTNRAIAYPPTFDHQALRIILRDILENYSVRGEGSEPVSALEIAGHMIKDSTLTIDTIFLISDGGHSLSVGSGVPQSSEITGQLRQQGVRVVAVGVGELIPIAIPVYKNGELVGYHRFEGRVAYTALDETPLKRFADETDGSFLRLTGLDDLVRITQSANLDSQPVAQEASISLVWIPTAFSILLIALWLLYPRPA